jgi:tetratricopeptide (TPR) repeat protein
MGAKDNINIKSKLSHPFSSNISVGDITYHVQTEDMGKKSSRIITNIYLKGEVVFSRGSDYAHLLELRDSEARIADLMDTHHRSSIEGFLAEQSPGQKHVTDYVEDIRQLLRKRKGKQALGVLRQGLQKFPFDPFLLSYYGYLIALVENRTEEGIRTCEDAIEKLKTSMPLGTEFFYPIFHLNLGRTYLKADRKSDAITAFRNGLEHNPENRDIQWELIKLGKRRRPAVPFLDRSNPINKYIGMLLRKTLKLY